MHQPVIKIRKGKKETGKTINAQRFPKPVDAQIAPTTDSFEIEKYLLCHVMLAVV